MPTWRLFGAGTVTPLVPSVFAGGKQTVSGLPDGSWGKKMTTAEVLGGSADAPLTPQLLAPSEPAGVCFGSVPTHSAVRSGPAVGLFPLGVRDRATGTAAESFGDAGTKRSGPSKPSTA